MTREQVKEEKQIKLRVSDEEVSLVDESVLASNESEATECSDKPENQCETGSTYGQVALPASSQDTAQLEENSEYSSLFSKLNDALGRSATYKGENFCDPQGAQLSSAAAIGICCVFVIVIIIATFIFCAFRDGVESLWSYSSMQMWVIMLPMAFISLPALTLLGNRLEHSGKYRLAETTHRLLYGLVGRHPHSAQYGPFAALELAAYYYSVGNLKKCDKVLKSLTKRIDTSNAELILIVESMRAAVAAKLGRIDEAKSLVDHSLQTFDESTFADRSKTESSFKTIFHTFIGDALLAANETESALKCFSVALERRTESTYEYRRNLIALCVRVGTAHFAGGRIAESELWLNAAFEALDSSDNNHHISVSVVTKLAELYKHQQRFDRAIELLEPITRFIEHTGVHNDLGAAHDLLGACYLASDRAELAAVTYDRAAGIRKKLFREEHPLVSESLKGRIAALKAAGNLQEADQAAYVLSTLSPATLGATSETEEPPPAERPRYKQFNLQNSRTTIFVLWIVWACSALVLQGFRAASSFDWTNLFCSCFFASVFLGHSAWKRHQKQKLRSKIAADCANLTATTVSFSVVADTEGWSNGLHLATIGAPFNCESFVKDDFDTVAGNMLHYGKKNTLNVHVTNGEPDAVVSDDGLVKLFPASETKSTVQQKARQSCFAWTGALLIPLMIVPFLVIPLMITNTNKELPKGLSAFEYYRHAASEFDSDVRYNSFYDLDKIRASYDAAAKADSSYFAALAARCRDSELPVEDLSENGATEYKEVAAHRAKGAEAKRILQETIDAAPKFDWAYTDMAQECINDKQFAEAQKFLDKALEVNPHSLRYVLTKARLEQAMGRKLEAIALAKKAFNIDPFYGPTHTLLLQLLL